MRPFTVHCGLRMWLSMRPPPSMLVWSWTNLTFASHIKDWHTFSLLELSFLWCPEFLLLFYLQLSFLVACGCFQFVHQVVSLCICKRFGFFLFSNITKMFSLPRFSGPGSQPAWTSCPKSLRQVVGDWAARVGSVGSRRFSMRARSSDRETAAPQIKRHNPARNTTQQHNTRPTTQHNTTTTTTTQHNLAPHIERHNPARLMQRGENKQQHIWRAAQEENHRFEPKKKCEDVWSRLSTYQASRWSISLSRKDQSVSTWAGSEEN